MIRMMSPDGTLGEIPEENVVSAQADGFRVMTDDDMKLMYNRIFLEHALFQDQRKKALTGMGRRMSRRMQMRSRRRQ